MNRQLLVVLGLFAILLGACMPPGQAQPSAKEQPTRGGTLIFALWQEPSALTSLLSNQTAKTVVSNTVTEGLAAADAEGNYQPVLAQSVPTVENGGVVLSSDGKKMSVTWKLKPDLLWSDGEPVTSADIVFTKDAWMMEEAASSRVGFSDIESITTPDPLTAVVTYKRVISSYPLNFFELLPKHLLEGDLGNISRTNYPRRPLGTGPFRVTDFRAGESITVERNPHYRIAGKPYLDGIIFKIVPSSQVAIAQLKAGEVHAMWNILESETPDLEGALGIELMVDPGATVERIELNLAANRDMTDPDSVHPVLGDIAVRKALLYATPKQQMIDSLLYGKANPGTSPISQGWASYRKPQEGYDPAKANGVLDAAGWVRGSDGIRSKAGTRASLTIVTTTGNQTRERVEQVLMDEYRQVGIELRIQNQPSSVLLSGSWSSGDPRKRGSFDLVMYGSTPALDPHFTMLRYHSSQIPSTANNGLGQNFTRFKNAEASRAIDEAGSTLDITVRRDAYHRALDELSKAYAIIWLYDRADIDARRSNVHGWVSNPWQEITSNTEDWYMK